jgi:hypothetical protein
MIVLWITLILISCAITVLFDWHYPVEKRTGLSVWRHWWHTPLLLIVTLIIGPALGFGLTFYQTMGVPPGPDGIWASSVGFIILWSITFTTLHVLWLNWQIRSLK